MLKNATVLYSGSLRFKGDPKHLARNPATGVAEYLLGKDGLPIRPGVEPEPIILPYSNPFPLTCPKCKHKSNNYRVYATEAHSILWCPFCSLYVWVKSTSVKGDL